MPGGWGLHFIKDSLLNVDANFQASPVHPTKPVWLLSYWLDRVLFIKLPSLKFELRVSQPWGQDPTWVCSWCFMDKDQVQITVLESILGSWARWCWGTLSTKVKEVCLSISLTQQLLTNQLPAGFVTSVGLESQEVQPLLVFGFWHFKKKGCCSVTSIALSIDY